MAIPAQINVRFQGPVYGIWSDQREIWAVNKIGELIWTPYECVAIAQLNYVSREFWLGKTWRVARMGRDGLPYEEGSNE